MTKKLQSISLTKKILRYFFIVITPIVFLCALGVGLAFYPVPPTISNTHTENVAVKKIRANGLEFAYKESCHAYR